MATHGKGVTFSIGDGGDPETFTKVGELTEIELPDWSRELVEVTHHESTAREYIAQPLVDYGEVVATMSRTPGSASDLALQAAFANEGAANFQLTVPAGANVETWTIPGIATNLSRSSPMDNTQTATLTIKVVGVPTRAVAPAA